MTRKSFRVLDPDITLVGSYGEMIMKTLGLGLLAVALLTGRVAVADEGKCDGKCATSQATCPVTAGMEKLPS